MQALNLPKTNMKIVRKGERLMVFDALRHRYVTLTPEEWEQAMDMLSESGIEDGFVQELSAAGEEQIPAFDGTGVERP